MLITSLEYILLIILTLIAFLVASPTNRRFVILAASIVFIYYISFNLLVYTLLFSAFNYLLGNYLQTTQNQTLRKTAYNLGIVLNVGLLVFYKYTNFIIDNVNSLLSISSVNPEIAHLNLIIPVGISFYTFQSISYLINVYRETIKTEKSFLSFYLYIIYFPKLFSGPIEEPSKFLPGLNRLTLNYADFLAGSKLIVIGLFKKIIIADRLMDYVTTIHGSLDNFHGIPILLLFLLQPLAIYFDFSGYTDIALGVSRLFGVKLTNNFDRPFFATNVSMFWRRWHISLSSWCNNYIFKRIVFIKRKWNNWASVYAVFVTFLVIGVWHGANWNFVILGLLQSTAITYEFFSKRKRLSIGQKIPLKLNNFVSRTLTYLFFCLTLVFFFSESFGNALYIIKNAFAFNALNVEGNNIGINKYELIITLVVALLYIAYEYTKEAKLLVGQKPYWVKWAIAYILIISIIIFGRFASNGFIYAQF